MTDRNPENFLLVESGILGIGVQNPAFGIQNPAKEWIHDFVLLGNVGSK